jgi:hypothetical protein
MNIEDFFKSIGVPAPEPPPEARKAIEDAQLLSEQSAQKVRVEMTALLDTAGHPMTEGEYMVNLQAYRKGVRRMFKELLAVNGGPGAKAVVLRGWSAMALGVLEQLEKRRCPCPDCQGPK